MVKVSAGAFSSKGPLLVSCPLPSAVTISLFWGLGCLIPEVSSDVAAEYLLVVLVLAALGVVERTVEAQGSSPALLLTFLAISSPLWPLIN